MELCVVRHTKLRVESGLCYGRLDLELEEGFCQQAERISQSLPLPFDLTYCSPLKRCTQLADYLGLSYQRDPRIREIDFGQWEGKRWDQIGKAAIDAWHADLCSYRFPGGESFGDLCDRVDDFLTSLPNKNILLITHAGVIKALHHLVEGVSIEAAAEFSVDYGEMLQLNIQCSPR